MQTKLEAARQNKLLNKQEAITEETPSKKRVYRAVLGKASPGSSPRLSQRSLQREAAVQSTSQKLSLRDIHGPASFQELPPFLNKYENTEFLEYKVRNKAQASGSMKIFDKFWEEQNMKRNEKKYIKKSTNLETLRDHHRTSDFRIVSYIGLIFTNNKNGKTKQYRKLCDGLWCRTFRPGSAQSARLRLGRFRCSLNKKHSLNEPAPAVPTALAHFFASRIHFFRALSFSWYFSRSAFT